jgi:O-antigen ligase
MNKISQLKEYILLNKFESLLFLYALFLPLRNNISGALMILLIIYSLFDLKFTIAVLKKSIKNKFLILFISLFIIHLLGLLYTSNFRYAFKDLDIKFPLLVFPFLLIGRGVSKNTIDLILKGFVIGCIICSIGAFSNSIQVYSQTRDVSKMLYEGMQFIMHSSYFALYLSFAIAYLFFKLDSKNSLFSNNNLAIFSLIFFFIIVVIFLNSRAGMIGLGVSFLFFLFYVIIEKRLKLFYFLISIFLLTSLFVLTTSSQIFNRFKLISKESVNVTSSVPNVEPVSNINNIDLRMAILTIGFDLFKESPVIGYGTGDIKDVLVEGYKKENFIKGYDRKYNCHNQFLQFLLAFGIIGLLVFLVSLVYPMFFAFFKKNYLYVFLILMLCFNFLFESMLETKAGVEFYAFFNALLIGVSYKKRD